MTAIEIMNEEHRYILRLLKVVRKINLLILEGKEVDLKHFELVVDFIKNYADNHHHRKEEDFLFNKMVDNIGETAEKVVKYGMLVEHDLGRLYVSGLIEAVKAVQEGNNEAKLDIIANAISYTHLLERHIDKEDRVIYKFAERELKEEVLATVNEECKAYEEANKAESDRCIKILEDLEEKYLGGN